MISGVSSAAVSVMQTGQRRLDVAAHEVAKGNMQDTQALTEALVSAQQAKHQVEAGVKMLKTADEVLGQVIDAFA